jgi:hypothetical protein
MFSATYPKLIEALNLHYLHSLISLSLYNFELPLILIDGLIQTNDTYEFLVEVSDRRILSVTVIILGVVTLIIVYIQG